MAKRILSHVVVGLALSAGIGGLVALASAQPVAVSATTPSGSLASFKSDADFLAWRRAREAAAAARPKQTCPDGSVVLGKDACPPPPPPPPPPPMQAPAAAESADSADAIVTTGSRVASDKITNTQEADVDEGGIVKKRGDLLVILRRGRLFTVSTVGGGIRPVDHIDAYPPGVSARGDWYDEMLISGNRVIVIGYSYARGGTEVNRFRLSSDGRLSFEDAYHLRSNDYYSSRNYASRLIGNRLVYYTPLRLDWSDPFASFPALDRWQDGRKTQFRRIAGGRDTYIVPDQRDDEDARLDTLHSVMDCDLTAPVMDCRATAVIGPSSRTFYVSGTGVYLWISQNRYDRDLASQAWLYRIPFDRRERPSAIGAMGQPTDQFSFREDRAAGLVDVLIRRQGGGDAMWRSENNPTDVALLSVPLRALGDGTRTVPSSRYRFLPGAGPDAWNFQNRFVGNHVLYGGHGYQRGQESGLVAVRLRGGPIVRLPLSHAVERIDQMGADGIAVGSDTDGALTFSSIDLTRPAARLGSAFTFPGAQQGETRSQAFFFRADNDDGSNGLLGLPITRAREPQFARFIGNAASILYLRRDQRRLAEAGRLDADPRGAVDDACQASCVDWYGNARPIFVGDRVFALMGYELVEGRQGRGGRIREVARTNFAPPPLGRDPR